MGLKQIFAAATAAVLALGITSVQAQVIVYQDTFDNDGLDVNAGVGGGGVATNINGAGGEDWGWDDVEEITANGDQTGLFAGTGASGNRISTFVSDSSFDLSGGFTLTVVFDQLFNDENGSNAAPPFLANHFSIGMLASDDTEANFFSNNNGDETLGGGVDAIGVSLGTRNANAELSALQWVDDVQTTLAGTLTNADVIGDDLTFVLTVDTAGAYTWTLGAATGSGTTAIDLSVPYHFKARTQASMGNSIESVTLEAQAPLGPPCLLGDVNQDTIVNFLDIAPFISVLSNSGTFQCEADCNEDGIVNFLDIAPFITILANQ